MDDSNLKGYPVPLLKTEDPEGELTLNDEAIKILLQDHVKDRAAVVISVVGAFRKGKSFLLDFFLRCMNLTYASSDEPNIANYLGDENSPLEGFKWRCGSRRCTTGIFMWSEIFCVKLPNGEEVGVIFLDTQGAFDTESTFQESSAIFAISTMISSIQIYNLSLQIQEDDLEHLRLFAEYGKLALETKEKIPFQKLMFLVRDWQCKSEHPYGNEGGCQYVNRIISAENKKPELKSLRKHIKSCFTDVVGFLLPHPGPKVAAGGPEFDGRLCDIDKEFKKYLQELITLLLSRENLLPKEICGHKVKVKELKQYLESYTNLFTDGVLPKPQSIFEANARANHLLELKAAEDTYSHSMKAYYESESCDQFESTHEELKEKALKQFSEKAIIGRDKFYKTYLEQLEKNIEDMYKRYKSINDAKIELYQQKENSAAVAAARESYHKKMEVVFCEKDTKFLSSDELKSQHDTFKKLVLKQFDAEPKTGGDNLKMFRQNLEKDIEIYYDRFEACNQVNKAVAETKNESAVAAMRKLYRQLMSEVSEKPNAVLKPDDLESTHKEITEKVFEQFYEQCGTERDDFLEFYRLKLEQEIEYDYAQLKINNESRSSCKKAEANKNNLMVATEAKDNYRKLMMEVCEKLDGNICSDVLESEHNKLKQTALSQSFESFEIAEDEFPESFRRKLKQDIEDEYVQIRKNNEEQTVLKSHVNRLSAVTASVEKYYQLMKEIFGEQTAYVSSATLEDEHIKCKEEAFDLFRADCETGGGELAETYREKLKKDIEDKYNLLKALNELKEANAKVNYLRAVENAAAAYHRNMVGVCENQNLDVDDDSDTLESEHFKFKREAIDEFQANCDMGVNEFYEYYRDELEKVIDEDYTVLRANNLSRINHRQVVATLNNINAMQDAKEMIANQMQIFIQTQSTASNFSLEAFKMEFIRCKNISLSLFEMRCQGGDELTRQSIERLENELEAIYTQLKTTVKTLIRSGGEGIGFFTIAKFFVSIVAVVLLKRVPII